MELSKALESIISMMGERVLIEDKCINALVDLKAFEFDPAIKNIFRVLKYEGYLEKINSNTDLGKIASEIERNYGFKKPLIEYIISSYAKALGIVQESNLNPSSSYCENDKDSTLEKTNTPQKPWGKMTYPEKIIYLEQKIEIDQQSFLECGIILEKVLIESIDNEVDEIVFNYEIKKQSRIFYTNGFFKVLINYKKNSKLRSIEAECSVGGDVNLTRLIRNIFTIESGTFSIWVDDDKFRLKNIEKITISFMPFTDDMD